MKIEMPSDIKKRVGKISDQTDGATNLEFGSICFEAAITYANEQLDKAKYISKVVNALTDIRTALKCKNILLNWEESVLVACEEIEAHIKNTNDDQPPEPWKPVEGMKCAFWDSEDEAATASGIFEEVDGDDLYISTFEHGFYYCAQLDSYDEIGKPPQYFLERDERHI